jgi:hypothetical protein
VGLRLAETATTRRPAIIAARVRDQRWRTTATINPAHGRGRLILRLDDRHWFAVEADSRAVSAVVAIGGVRVVLGSIARQPETFSKLTISSTDPQPPCDEAVDVIEMSYAVGSTVSTLGRFDGRYLSTEVAGGFTGRVVGVEVVEGVIDVGEIEYVANKG